MWKVKWVPAQGSTVHFFKWFKTKEQADAFARMNVNNVLGIYYE
jgi:hypothetical protein